LLFCFSKIELEEKGNKRKNPSPFRHKIKSIVVHTFDPILYTERPVSPLPFQKNLGVTASGGEEKDSSG